MDHLLGRLVVNQETGRIDTFEKREKINGQDRKSISDDIVQRLGFAVYN